MDLEDELDDLEESFSKTEQEFEKVKEKDSDADVVEKQERAEELINEIRGQLEFLKDQV